MPGTEDFVQVAPNGTGAKIRNFLNTVGANAVDQQVVTLANSDATLVEASGLKLAAGTSVIGHVVVDSAGAVSITSLPALPAGTSLIGHVIVDSVGGTLDVADRAARLLGHVNVDDTTYFTAGSVLATASGNTAIYTPSAGKAIRLYYIAYSADTSVGTGQVVSSIRFGTGGALRYSMALTGNQAFARGIGGGKRYLTAAADVVLYANQDAAASVRYSYEIDEV